MNPFVSLFQPLKSNNHLLPGSSAGMRPVRPFSIKGVFLVLMLLVSSCSGSQNRNEEKQREITAEDLIEANRHLVNSEQKKIQEYLSDQNIEMDKTGTGMWYHISDEGVGDPIQTGQIVTLNYEVRLLDGTLCYDSDDRGPQKFKVGQGNVESGLEQGILMLRKGAEAQFIMPPHLAHGLVGDDNRIPSRAIIIYDVEVVEVQSP
jgi:FKBP-type peptidyl-prolyl cis-trans isomerase